MVEDDPAIADLLRDILAEAGYRSVVVPSPAAAVRTLADMRFAVVLTDAFGATPAEVLPSTAAVLAAAGSTPVVLCTAHAIDPDTVRRAGFGGVIAKPFDVATLLAQLQVLLAA